MHECNLICVMVELFYFILLHTTTTSSTWGLYKQVVKIFFLVLRVQTLQIRLFSFIKGFFVLISAKGMMVCKATCLLSMFVKSWGKPLHSRSVLSLACKKLHHSDAACGVLLSSKANRREPWLPSFIIERWRSSQIWQRERHQFLSSAFRAPIPT